MSQTPLLVCFCVCSQELIKYSKGCEGVVELQAALSSLLGILKAVNDSMHLIAINGYEVRHGTKIHKHSDSHIQHNSTPFNPLLSEFQNWFRFRLILPFIFDTWQGNLGDLGRLLMQGSFSVWAEHKRGHVKMMDLARFKPMQRHLFLHEKALLFCKKREENGEGYEKAPSYSFKQELSVSVCLWLVPICDRKEVCKTLSCGYLWFYL